jgi:hypothetical protein
VTHAGDIRSRLLDTVFRRVRCVCQGTRTFTKLLNPISYELPAGNQFMGVSPWSDVTG